ncbi:hypothetical protein D9M72_389240 [compost metagenome]
MPARRHLAAALGDQRLQPAAQPPREGGVADHQVGFEIQRQAERVEVAGTHRGPLFVDDGDLAVERPLHVLEDLHPRVLQVAIQQATGARDPRHVGLALQQQAHLYAARGGFAQRVQQPVARQEISVGNDHLAPRGADRIEVGKLDVVAMAVVVARDQPHRTRRRRGAARRRRCQPALQACPGDGPRQEVMHLPCRGAGDLDGVVLLGPRPVAVQVLRREIDAADKGHLAVDRDQLAVHAPEDMRAHAQQAAARRECAEVHARLDQLCHECRGQVMRAEAVHCDGHAHAAPRGGQQRGVQFRPCLVVEQDKSFHQHAFARSRDRLENAREVLFSVLQQANAVGGGRQRCHGQRGAANTMPAPGCCRGA